MKKLNFWLPDELHAAINRYKKTTGVPVSELIRRAVVDFLKKVGG